MSLYEKPLAAQKFRTFYKNVLKNNGRMGRNVRAIHLNYNNVCNFKCDFCYTNAPDQPNARLKLDLEALDVSPTRHMRPAITNLIYRAGELLINVDKTLELSRP